MKLRNNFAKILLLIALTLVAFQGKAQMVVTASVLDSSNNLQPAVNYPIYVHVRYQTPGISFTQFGVYTDTLGRFTLNIPQPTFGTQATFTIGNLDCNGIWDSTQVTKFISPNDSFWFSEDTISCVTPDLTCNADFTFTNTLGGGAAFLFNQTSTHQPIGYVPNSTSISHFWDFGDNSTDTGSSPIHTYQSPGTYNVCLTTTTIVGTTGLPDTCISTTCRQLTYKSCQAAYAATPSLSNPFLINFLDVSTVAPGPGTSVSRTWDFGDGTIKNNGLSTEIHSYNQTGVFYPTLTIRAIQGTDTCNSTYLDSVVINNVGGGLSCSAGFIDSARVGMPWIIDFFGNHTVTGGTPNSTVITYSWDFGDGTTVPNVPPVNIVHTYSNNPNSYQVQLTVRAVDSITGDTCSSSFSNTVTIPSLACYPSFTFSTATNSLNVAFKDSLNSLIFSYYGIASVNRIWNFGDSTMDTGQAVSHTYASAGSYTACMTLIVTDVAGDTCTSTRCLTFNLNSGPFCDASYVVDTVNSFFGNVIIWNTSLPQSNQQGFTNLFLWNFGDGTTSTLPFPTHTYSNPGTYAVSLSLLSTNNFTGDTCSDFHMDTLGIDSLGNLIYKQNVTNYQLIVMDPATISIGESNLDEVKIYPNPARDYVVVERNEAMGELKYSLVDIGGKVIKQGAYPRGSSAVKIELEEFKAGIYILQLKNNSSISHHKVRVDR